MHFKPVDDMHRSTHSSNIIKTQQIRSRITCSCVVGQTSTDAPYTAVDSLFSTICPCSDAKHTTAQRQPFDFEVSNWAINHNLMENPEDFASPPFLHGGPSLKLIPSLLPQSQESIAPSAKAALTTVNIRGRDALVSLKLIPSLLPQSQESIAPSAKAALTTVNIRGRDALF